MCGIYGGAITPTQTRLGLHRIKRGNDGMRIQEWPEYGVSLGYRRFAVIAPDDPSSMQPIVKEDERVSIVLNGEIFNYQSLRSELHTEGFSFQSKGDAETVLNLYLQKDNQFCENLNSMFAGAIFDWRTKPRILIFRDWIGEEPLHYILDPERKIFVFSSEIKGFLDLPEYDFARVKTLEPGSVMEVNLEDYSQRSWTYYRLELTSNSAEYHGLAQIGKRVRDLIDESAAERIVADVPVCCLLSGGLDSIVTTYVIANLLKKKGIRPALYTFHVAEQPIVPGTDLYHARIAASALGLRDKLVEVIVPAKEIIRILPKTIYALEDKRLRDFNVYPALYNYLIAQRVAHDGYKIAFNGEGSDELQGSYASWGSFSVRPDQITQPKYRLNMMRNLHKGVLMRTSKVMMYAGPVEMRSPFLSRRVAEYMVNIPARFLRSGNIWKMPLVEAFKNEIPLKLLQRPKARPQDSTGIMALRESLLRTYAVENKTEWQIFDQIFRKVFQWYVTPQNTQDNISIACQKLSHYAVSIQEKEAPQYRDGTGAPHR